MASVKRKITAGFYNVLRSKTFYISPKFTALVQSLLTETEAPEIDSILVSGAGIFYELTALPSLLNTSRKGMTRKLRKRWATLYRDVYLAGGLVTLHFSWLVKSDNTEPLTYSVIVLALMLLRIPAIRR